MFYLFHIIPYFSVLQFRQPQIISVQVNSPWVQKIDEAMTARAPHDGIHDNLCTELSEVTFVLQDSQASVVQELKDWKMRATSIYQPSPSMIGEVGIAAASIWTGFTTAFFSKMWIFLSRSCKLMHKSKYCLKESFGLYLSTWILEHKLHVSV